MDSKDLAWKIRRHGIEMTHISHGSHIGSILSVTDIVAVLYADIMKFDPKKPKLDSRDRLILSKGHAGASIYAALAEVGFFSVDELNTHYSDGSRLSGHVSHKNVPGVELSTGSLGHGLSVGAGMALAAKRDGKNHRIFVICGDGECDEGSMWEAILFANQFKLNNLTLIIDHNKLQSLDLCENTIELLSLADKFISFGWNVIEVDGHNHIELKKALLYIDKEKPTCIVANTIKGKGVSFMENQVLWHYRDPQGDLYELAVKELEESKNER
jgi:transketolase